MSELIAELLTLSVETSRSGEVVYRNSCGRIHRTFGPAITRPDGYQAWYQNGRLHRTDGPAVIWSDVTQMWYLNGQPHRKGGPAVVYSTGDLEWYLYGHRLTEVAYHAHNIDEIE